MGRSSRQDAALQPAPFEDVELEQARKKRVEQVENENEVAVLDDTDIHLPRPTTRTEEMVMVELYGAEHPWNWTKKRRWKLSILTGVLLFNSTVASSAPSGAAKAIEAEFNTSPLETALIVSMFLFGYCAGPFCFAPLSETYGRRLPFIIGLALFTIFQGCCGASQNIATLLVLRFLAGTAAAGPQTNSGSVIGDLWSPADRGLPQSLFALMPYLGPSIGPLIAGFSSTTIGWRWTFHILTIFSGFLLIVTIFCLEETYPPVLRYEKARALRKKGQRQYHSELDLQRKEWRSNITVWFYRPIELLCKEIILSLMVLYTSLMYAIVYLLFGAFPVIFGEVHGLSPGLSGATFTILFNRHYLRKVEANGGKHVPEWRLPPGIVGCGFFTIGMLWLGWTGYKPQLNVFLPMVAGIIIGFSSVLVFRAFNSYLIDVYKKYSASALAATVIARSLLAGILPLFTDQMFKAMGIQWTCTFLAALTAVLFPVPFLFIKYGERLRARSKFAVSD